jgi:hypothetical protein
MALRPFRWTFLLLLFLVGWDWVHLVLWPNWPIVPAPDDRWWWLWISWWNEDWQGKPKYSEKTLLDLGRFFSFLIFYTVGRTPWKGDQPVSRPLPTHTGQHKHRTNAYRHPCLKWDSNPRSQCFSGQREFMPQTAQPLWSASISLLNTKQFH